MRIISPKGFIPIVISGMAVNATPQDYTFKYNDVDQKKIRFIEDNSTDEYLKNSESSYSDLLIKFKFQDLLKSWQSETLFLSSPKEIIENENFKKIVKLGKPAVPYIIEELKEDPTYLVWALNFIYDIKVSNNPNTTIPEAAKLWVKLINSGQIG